MKSNDDWIEDYKRMDPHAKIGMRVRLISMDDDFSPIEKGEEGTITSIDGLGSIHVNWDNGRTLALIPNEDKYVLLPPNEKHQKPKDTFYENKKLPLTTKVSRDFKQSVNKSKLNIKTENLDKEIPSFRDEVNRILDTIKTAKPIHVTSLENMVKNLNNKYRGVKKNEEKFREIILKLYQEIENKFGLDETTTTGSAMGSTPIQPLGSTIHKNSTKKTKTKGDLKNPTGVKYSIAEETSLKSLNKNREDSTFDRPTWADKKTWIKLKNLAWKDGEVIDISKYLDVDSQDPVVIKTKKKLKESKKNVVKSEDEDNIEETTTMSSVFNGNFPVTPYMFAKKGKHKPSKKTLWKGGKIVQKVDRADLLGEDVLGELNKVKWVKNGKFVKIKDRCAKYNNQPHCSQGAIDNPLIFSEETINNIKKVSEDYGVDFNYLINLVKENTKDFGWVDDINLEPWEEFMFPYTNLKGELKNTSWGSYINYNDDSGKFIFFHSPDIDEDNIVWFNYEKVWKPLKDKFNLNMGGVDKLLRQWLMENYRMDNVRTLSRPSIS